MARAAPRNRTIELRDGRRLAYEERGAADGVPVLFFHGAPGSRLRQPHGDEARVRVITVDRPGYGLSGFQRDRTILDRADDVRQLADTSGLDSFCVAGVSGGGAHAAACAFRLGRRVRRAALIASSAPFDEPGVLDGMRPLRRMMYPLVRKRTALARVVLRSLRCIRRAA